MKFKRKNTKQRKKYIVWAPPYEKSNGVRALYKLCEELNNFGYDAHVFSGPPYKEGVRYLKKLTKEMKKNDIIIYPESLPGNPLEFKRVVRWVLFYPGQIGGDKNYEKNEIVFSWLKDYYDAPILQVQHLDHELFYEDKNIVKDTDSYFVYKGGQCRTFPELEKAVKITYDYPQTRKELAQLLRRTKTLYSFDDKSALNNEALLCGAKVKIVTPDGMYEHTTTEEVSYDYFKNEIENFIKITQDERSWVNKHFLPRWIFYKISTPTHTKLRFFGFIKFKYKRRVK